MVVKTPMGDMSKNKPNTSMPYVACKSTLRPGNWMAIGRAVVYYARATHVFSAGIKCQSCVTFYYFFPDFFPYHFILTKLATSIGLTVYLHLALGRRSLSVNNLSTCAILQIISNITHRKHRYTVTMVTIQTTDIVHSLA